MEKKKNWKIDDIQSYLKHIGFIGSIITMFVYTILVVILVIGFEAHTNINNIIFAVINAVIGIILALMLREQGIIYAKGDTGLQGFQGEKGDKGDQGEKGEPGKGELVTTLCKRSYYSAVILYDQWANITGAVTAPGYYNVTEIYGAFYQDVEDDIPYSQGLQIFFDNLKGSVTELKMGEEKSITIGAITSQNKVDYISAKIMLTTFRGINFVIKLDSPIMYATNNITINPFIVQGEEVIDVSVSNNDDGRN